MTDYESRAARTEKTVLTIVITIYVLMMFSVFIFCIVQATLGAIGHEGSTKTDLVGGIIVATLVLSLNSYFLALVFNDRILTAYRDGKRDGRTR